MTSRGVRDVSSTPAPAWQGFVPRSGEITTYPLDG